MTATATLPRPPHQHIRDTHTSDLPASTLPRTAQPAVTTTGKEFASAPTTPTHPDPQAIHHALAQIDAELEELRIDETLADRMTAVTGWLAEIHRDRKRLLDQARRLRATLHAHPTTPATPTPQGR